MEEIMFIQLPNEDNQEGMCGELNTHIEGMKDKTIKWEIK